MRGVWHATVGWCSREDGWCAFKSPTGVDTGQSGPGAPYPGRVSRPLEIAACRRLCSWDATGEDLDGRPLFACAGCGSEWVATEQWTPVDWTGVVPEPVQAARRGRGRG